ncbi:MAG: (Fe-S)-binding protein [Deltaproteobacteria bacterium]|nr:MAG: (Fe-S)-binding protein [Deltaproteobacteria bacterium]
MRVALFVPCYVDQLWPDVALAALRVLERVGCRVDYDPDQTCCGQPFLNAGATAAARRLASRHLTRFAGSEAVVCPSASCVATVRERYREIGAFDGAMAEQLARRTFELGEFLVAELGVEDVGAAFPHRVALLHSCHGLRDLGLGTPSERAAGAAAAASIPERLLGNVRGLELTSPERSDECCGFGGLFSVRYPEVSSRIGRGRASALAASGAEYVTGTDASCLLHLDGIRRREGLDLHPIHLAEILAATGDA